MGRENERNHLNGLGARNLQIPHLVAEAQRCMNVCVCVCVCVCIYVYTGGWGHACTALSVHSFVCILYVYTG